MQQGWCPFAGMGGQGTLQGPGRLASPAELAAAADRRWESLKAQEGWKVGSQLAAADLPAVAEYLVMCCCC